MAKVALVVVLIAVAFAIGFRLGASYGVERVKHWWLEKGRNTHNPHYRIIE